MGDNTKNAGLVSTPGTRRGVALWPNTMPHGICTRLRPFPTGVGPHRARTGVCNDFAHWPGPVCAAAPCVRVTPSFSPLPLSLSSSPPSSGGAGDALPPHPPSWTGPPPAPPHWQVPPHLPARHPARAQRRACCGDSGSWLAGWRPGGWPAGEGRRGAHAVTNSTPTTDARGTARRRAMGAVCIHLVASLRVWVTPRRRVGAVGFRRRVMASVAVWRRQRADDAHTAVQSCTSATRYPPRRTRAPTGAYPSDPRTRLC